MQAFISTFQVTESNDANFLGMGGVPSPGKWFIPSEKLQEFHHLLAQEYLDKKKYFFVSKWLPNRVVHRLCIDFDVTEKDFDDDVWPQVQACVKKWFPNVKDY